MSQEDDLRIKGHITALQDGWFWKCDLKKKKNEFLSKLKSLIYASVFVGCVRAAEVT